MIVANIINIGANYVLVYGMYGFPELGAEGSIWATFIVRLAQVFAILSYVWFFSTAQNMASIDRFGVARGARNAAHWLCVRRFHGR